jgi:uncharacterized membrane protein YraQ (UPF0718 family)
MDALINLFSQTLSQVWLTFTHNWPFLLVSILIAVALKLYADPAKVSGFLIRHKGAGVVSATVAAVATPLCSCGTTAVILGMMASMMPWAPIVAFMVASPLTSPEELVYSAGLFGWPFAIAFFAASIVLGLLGGAAANIFESRGWLKGQSRFNPTPAAPSRQPVRIQPTCACGGTPEPVTARSSLFAASSSQPALAACACGETPEPLTARASLFAANSTQPALSACGCGGETAELALNINEYAYANQPALAAASQHGEQSEPCSCGSKPARPERARVTPRLFLAEALTSGQRLLLMFFGFAFIGYFLNGLIPAAWVSAVFGAGNAYSIPLAATLGLPLYINTEASLPLVRALIDGGMSQGAALAFLITGAGTSIGAMAGAMAIARWRVIALVVGVLWVGAILLGGLFDLLLATGLV